MSSEAERELSVKCLKLFLDGNDTKAISMFLQEQECEVERKLHKALEERRRNQPERK